MHTHNNCCWLEPCAGAGTLVCPGPGHSESGHDIRCVVFVSCIDRGLGAVQALLGLGVGGLEAENDEHRELCRGVGKRQSLMSRCICIRFSYCGKRTTQSGREREKYVSKKIDAGRRFTWAIYRIRCQAPVP